MDPGSLLATIAQVAAAFVGFTGVIFAVGRLSQGALRGPERQALVHLQLPSLVALFMAMFALAALIGIRDEAVVWRISNGLLAVFHAPLVSHGLWMSNRAEVAEPIEAGIALMEHRLATALEGRCVVGRELGRGGLATGLPRAHRHGERERIGLRTGITSCIAI